MPITKKTFGGVYSKNPPSDLQQVGILYKWETTQDLLKALRKLSPHFNEDGIDLVFIGPGSSEPVNMIGITFSDSNGLRSDILKNHPDRLELCD